MVFMPSDTEFGMSADIYAVNTLVLYIKEVLYYTRTLLSVFSLASKHNLFEKVLLIWIFILTSVKHAGIKYQFKALHCMNWVER